MSAKRELYREGTPENIKKGYTELVYAGENIEVDKGVISGSSGGSGGSGEEGMKVIALEFDEDDNLAGGIYEQIDEAYNQGDTAVLKISSDPDMRGDFAYLIGQTYYNAYPGYAFISFSPDYPNLIKWHFIGWRGDYNFYDSRTVNLQTQT